MLWNIQTPCPSTKEENILWPCQQAISNFCDLAPQLDRRFVARLPLNPQRTETPQNEHLPIVNTFYCSLRGPLRGDFTVSVTFQGLSGQYQPLIGQEMSGHYLLYCFMYCFHVGTVNTLRIPSGLVKYWSH